MERGFGWHYPPGTPGPTRTAATARCSECGETREITIETDLGATFYLPEESPCCGAEWSDEEAEPYTRDDYLADHEDEYRGPR